MVDDKPQYEEAIFKQFVKKRNGNGALMSITPFTRGGRFKIDIGEANSNDKLIQATATYVDMILLLTFLRAVVHDRADTVFYDKTTKSPATLVSYGGSKNDGNVVARLLQITPMFEDFNNKVYVPGSSFMWKCGHFEGSEMKTGAFKPDMSKLIQKNDTIVTRQTMEEITVRIELYLDRVIATGEFSV